ncbi:MAG: acetate--CoA ligase family protein [Thermoanaerobaculaceae bacterium]|nr:acetate--CoA ligase family protein [Thermoanaerobaculaceae bacterium]
MPGSLEAILRPRSLAVVGASSRAESLSGRLLGNLLAAGYAGAVYPVNPRAETIGPFKCYPNLRAIPTAVDLAVVMVPKDAVLATIDECLEVGVKGVVVITAGFREAGEAGAEVERRVLERVRRAGVRMIGPNCMGLINTDSDVRMDVSFTPAPALPGTVAFASHSGALGVAVLEAAREVGLGFSQFVSLGNSADVDVNELLEVWEHHDGTRVIMLYLESLPGPRRFLELASRISRSKPIVVFKGGRTAAGQRAASSHTGALASGDTAVDALLTQAGAVRARTLEEMFNLALGFSSAPLPKGRRVAVVTNAGGPAIAATDALADHGLTLASFSPATEQALRSFLPAEAAVGNPVDMLPSATPDNFRQAIELALADRGVDAALTITVTPIMVTPLQIAGGIASARLPGDKPVLSVFMTNSRFFPEAHGISGLPALYRYPEAAVEVLAGLAAHAERASRPAAAAPALAATRGAVIEGAATRGPGYLPPRDAFALLEGAGISVAPWRAVQGRGELANAGRALSYPVVLKAFGEGLIHKSEVGAVAVGLADESALVAAFEAMRRRLAEASVEAEGFLVQSQVSGGREVIMGITRDPAVGSLVMVGMGGVAVEVWKDVSFRVAPITGEDAEAMLAELKGARLLGAFRGRPAGDRAAMIQALVRLSALAASHPEIVECDVNPLLVMDDGKGCVAVDVRVRVAG